MGYLNAVLLSDWALFTCKQPLNVWLLGTYAYLTATHFFGIVSKHSAQDLVELTLMCVYFFIFVPFSIVWTILGTIWYYTETDLTCVPEYLRGVGMLFVLMISYLYVSVSVALLLMFAMMFCARHQLLSELSFIIVPNDDQRADHLSQSLLEQLGNHTCTVSSESLRCPICYEDIPVGCR